MRRAIPAWPSQREEAQRPPDRRPGAVGDRARRGAYVGGRLLNRGAGRCSGGQAMMARGEGGVARSFSLLPAKELPQNTPDVRGVVVRRQDKSLFVGTGRLTRMSDEAPTTYDGPVLEVVVTHDTQIFCDDTARSRPTSRLTKSSRWSSRLVGRHRAQHRDPGLGREDRRPHRGPDSGLPGRGRHTWCWGLTPPT